MTNSGPKTEKSGTHESVISGRRSATLGVRPASLGTERIDVIPASLDMLEMNFGTAYSGKHGFANGMGPKVSETLGHPADTLRHMEQEAARLGAVIEKGGSAINSQHRKRLTEIPALLAFLFGRKSPILAEKEAIKAIFAANNAKSPGRNFQFFDTAEEAVDYARLNLRFDESLSCVTTIGKGYHALGTQIHRHACGRLTMLVLEPLKIINPTNGAKRRTTENYEAYFLDSLGEAADKVTASPLFLHVGSQRDYTSCLGIMPDYMKSLERNPEFYLSLHELALHGGLAELCGPPKGQYYHLESDAASTFLPLDLYKNLQSSSLLAEILNKREDALHLPINSNGETLAGRLARITGKEWIKLAKIRPGETPKFMRSKGLRKSDRALPILMSYARLYRKGARYLRDDLGAQAGPGL